MPSSQNDLQAIIAHWKPLLGLHSWDIRAEYAPRHEIEAAATGNIKAHMERAAIKVQRDCDRDGDGEDAELDLLHELVHIRLWAIDPDEADPVTHKCREAAVEWIARALYVARHGKAPWVSPYAGGGEE